jgi:hypothetical protein
MMELAWMLNRSTKLLKIRSAFLWTGNLDQTRRALL